MPKSGILLLCIAISTYSEGKVSEKMAKWVFFRTFCIIFVSLIEHIFTEVVDTYIMNKNTD